MSSSVGVLTTAARSAGPSGVLLLVVALLDAGTRLALPAALGLAVDAALRATPSMFLVIAVCVLVLLATSAEMLREVSEATAKARGTLTLRRAVVRHLVDVGLPAQRQFGTGSVLSRLLESTAEASTVTPTGVLLVTSLVTSIGGLVALFTIDLSIGLLFVVAAPAAWWLMRWLIGRMAATTVTYQQAHGEICERFVNAVSGARTIRASGTVDREIDRVLQPLDALRAAGKEFWDMQRRAGWQLGLVSPAVQIAALSVAGFGVTAGRLSPGELLATVGYTGYAMGLLRQVSGFARLARARGSASRVAELLSLPCAPSGDRHLPPGGGELRLRGIEVRKGGRLVLAGLDLTVPAGKAVAIVGASGGGKSSLAEVAGGLLTPDRGTVSLDGIRLDRLCPQVRRAAFGYAFGRPLLLGTTVAQAVAYADAPLGGGRVHAALQASAAADFVARLPQGAGTRVDEVRLSGGELQRIGLARALCRDARVIVLDDATSSVDTATEADIFTAMEWATPGITRLLVAHRMSTAMRADLVAWLESGRVRALAPHAELMADPEYRGLFLAEVAPEEVVTPTVSESATTKEPGWRSA